MTHNDGFSGEGSQFVLSYELLCLLRWFVDHDADKLKKLITKAIESGLKDELRTDDDGNQLQMQEDIQYSILEFFSLLESLVTEAINEQAVKKAVEKNLMPAIDQIDSTVCDDATVRFSIERAASKIDHNPKENPKELLFKELLKRWKPSNKKMLN